MYGNKRIHPDLPGHLAFFSEFLKHPLQIGSIIPSSHFLERRILQAARIASARTIVELGSGTGGTTRAILREMKPDARLLSIEINQNFHQIVRNIPDDRLTAHQGNALELPSILSLHGLPPPDAVVSGIPFSTMPHEDGCRIVHAISSCLAENGYFVAYQVSGKIAKLCIPHLGPVHVGREFINIPPMRVYQWRKNGNFRNPACRDRNPGISDPSSQ